MQSHGIPTRYDGRIILHFVRSVPSSVEDAARWHATDPDCQDYDCFYASVFEAKNPALKSLPFAVQQKQIIVTCNYEARRRGLYKLQLITDAKRICPDVIIELGEDISQFRDASKDLYRFIRAYSWNDRVERLGFDEVWLDVTDVIDYNMELLNTNDLANAFFQTSRHDPTLGFLFDASSVAGHSYPPDATLQPSKAARADFNVAARLCLGSHLALHIRHQLEKQKGYTSTVGIATNKLISKLVGNLNKPKGQTTLLTPIAENTTAFLDAHEVGKIPGIGFKMAQKLREHVLGRSADFDKGLVYGTTRESVTVADVRRHPGLGPETLTKLLAGPGSPHGIGSRIWHLLHGRDDSEVAAAKNVPSQISIEDSYIRLDTMPEVRKQLRTLACSLLTRMRIDLLDDRLDDEVDMPYPEDQAAGATAGRKQWMAHPRTLRLTTRPRQPLLPDGTRVRSFKRISHSGPLPTFVFSLNESIDGIADKLVQETLITMFHRLHPEKAGWNLSLMNLAVTNMSESAGDSKTAKGRDIGKMFRHQEDVLKDFRVYDNGENVFDNLVHERSRSPPDGVVCNVGIISPKGGERALVKAGELHTDLIDGTDEDSDTGMDAAWLDEAPEESDDETCGVCGSRIPAFAMRAHRRYHDSG